ncbi:unnamed protein product [Prorocentrum cordatum]|uniref:ATP-dependent RNA helicase n=1 Tax=Prorocentrum cordatum TaxID=2364126 RepID=A0ABN9TP26_9DINO|nr:unnamed protein product [Polarella glacialis]
MTAEGPVALSFGPQRRPSDAVSLGLPRHWAVSGHHGSARQTASRAPVLRSCAASVSWTLCSLSVARRSRRRQGSARRVHLAAGAGAARETSADAAGRPWRSQDLPIKALLPEVLERVAAHPNLVLQAETGAGKTTMVPLAVLDDGRIRGRILVLQPRRIVCIEAAKRMAQMWGEDVGGTVGYRIRHDSRCGPGTRLEIITEGILLRMLQNNPTLEGIGAIFFDEFHERNLDSDMSLTLALKTQKDFNPELRLIVMSATLGGLGERLRNLLDCPLVFSEGRCFPVEVKHVGSMSELSFNWEALRDHQLEHFVADQVVKSIREHDGDVLVFLPGESEIMYTWAVLNNMGYGDGTIPANIAWQARQIMEEGRADPDNCVEVVPLYGSMGRDDQEQALRHRGGWRKVLLATPIAESSLTLPSIKVVIDTGLRRTVFTDPKTGVTFMKTVPVSAASADQRKGRAGRVSAGTCYRLWNESEHKGLKEQDLPELHLGDLCSAVLELSLAGCCSEASIAELPWVDPPHADQLTDACALLARMKAIESVDGDDGCMRNAWRLTFRGRELSRFPLHPRLSHMILQARQVSRACAIDACHLAALLEDKDILTGSRKRYGADVQIRLDAFKNTLGNGSRLDASSDQSNVMKDVNMLVMQRASRTSQQLQRVARIEDIEDGPCSWESDGCPAGILIAWACPELLGTRVDATTRKQIAYARRGNTTYRMFSGNEGSLHDDGLRRCEHIAVARAQDNKIFLAAEVKPDMLDEYGIDFANPIHHDVMGCLP